jgi:uncharacterized membrane protein YfcA
MADIVWWKWALAAFSAFSIGVAKTGVPGLGILAVPLFVLAVGDARLSAGWLLPLLITADAFAVWYYRKHNATKALFTLAPWVMAGMAIGAAVLGYPEHIIRPVVGGIILTILILFLLRRRGIDLTPRNPTATAGIYGSAAGFATMVANAAGPVMNVYLLSRKLPREEFVATGAWFFFFINLSKFPVYWWRGMISGRSLLFDLMLIPMVIAGALVGRKVLEIMPEHVFITSVTVLAFIATVLLFLPR